jgi:hypothetical protein
MDKLAAVACESAKPDKGHDRLLGDGLFLHIRPQGTKTWLIEYEFGGKRRKYTIGAYSREGAPGDSLPEWLRHGRLSLSQARAIAGNWKDARRAGHDPVAEWEAQLAREREAEAAKKAAEEAETARPTVRQAIDTFMARLVAGKKSAQAYRYRQSAPGFQARIWQEQRCCPFPLQQNAGAFVTRQEARKTVADKMRAVFNAPDRMEAERLLKAALEVWRKEHPKLAEWAETALPESLTVFDVPAAHRLRLRTTNGLERTTTSCDDVPAWPASSSTRIPA